MPDEATSAYAPAFTVEEVSILDYTPHPRNWRIHTEEQREAYRASLARFGYADMPILNRRTRHILDGHMRMGDAADEGETRLLAQVMDMSPEDEDAFLATFDHITGMAERDTEKLASLLEDLKKSQGELPPGYDEDDLTALRALNEADEKGRTKREKDKADTAPEDIQKQWMVLVECRDEEQQVELIERLQREGYEVRALL